MDAEKKQPTISIITATLNVAHVLPRLIDSLAAQTDQDFEWVVADGGSTDGTLELLEEAKSRLKSVIVDSRPDFGIYDAMNRAVNLIRGEYYLIAGADDEFFPEAVANYKKEIMEFPGADMVSAKVEISGKILSHKTPSWIWLFGSPAKISSHSIGVAIRKDAHEKYGVYDLGYRIYADGHFMLKIIKCGGIIKQADFVAGVYSVNGISNRSRLLSFCEQMRAQVDTGSSWVVQLVLFCLRVIKWGCRGNLTEK